MADRAAGDTPFDIVLSESVQRSINDVDDAEQESQGEEVAFKSEVNAELKTGSGEEARKYCCTVPELTLDASQEKQWKQIGSDTTGLRLQVRFVKKSRGFVVADIRATIPDAPSLSAIGPAVGAEATAKAA